MTLIDPKLAEVRDSRTVRVGPAAAGKFDYVKENSRLPSMSVSREEQFPEGW
jgi:hypothetical protein